MGLVQKRIIAEYKETEFPKWKTQIEAAAGFDLPIEVRWDTVASDDYEDRATYFRWIDQVWFRPLLTVIKNICVDEMGRAAFREHVKKVTFNGTEGHGPHHSTFDGGHLLIKHKVYTNVDDENERIKGWQKMIEQKL